MTSAESLIVRKKREETETTRFIVKGRKLFKATFPKICSVHRMSTYDRQ